LPDWENLIGEYASSLYSCHALQGSGHTSQSVKLDPINAQTPTVPPPLRHLRDEGYFKFEVLFSLPGTPAEKQLKKAAFKLLRIFGVRISARPNQP
jgi:hypothetical protein